jgi:hypothetical protein
MRLHTYIHTYSTYVIHAFVPTCFPVATQCGSGGSLVVVRYRCGSSGYDSDISNSGSARARLVPSVLAKITRLVDSGSGDSSIRGNVVVVTVVIAVLVAVVIVVGGSIFSIVVVVKVVVLVVVEVISFPNIDHHDDMVWYDMI